LQNLEELDAKTAGDLNAVLAGLWRIGAADLARMIAEKGVEAPDLDRVSTILKLLKRG